MSQTVQLSNLMAVQLNKPVQLYRLNDQAALPFHLVSQSVSYA